MSAGQRTPAFAPVRVASRNGAAIVTVAGVATLPVLVAARMQGICFAIEQYLERVLIDCSAAIVAMSSADWEAYTGRCLAFSLEAPAGEGYLLNAALRQDVGSHCNRMNHSGRICLSFDDRARAHRWALQSANGGANRSRDAFTEAASIISRSASRGRPTRAAWGA